MEAEKMQITLGKLVSMICDEYVKFLENKEGAHDKKEVQTSV